MSLCECVTPQSVIDDFFAMRSSIEDMPLKEIEETLAPNVIKYVNGVKLTDLQVYNLAEFMATLYPKTMMVCWEMMGRGHQDNTIRLQLTRLADGRLFSQIIMASFEHDYR